MSIPAYRLVLCKDASGKVISVFCLHHSDCCGTFESLGRCWRAHARKARREPREVAESDTRVKVAGAESHGRNRLPPRLPLSLTTTISTL